jgi:hypothetical protein
MVDCPAETFRKWATILRKIGEPHSSGERVFDSLPPDRNLHQAFALASTDLKLLLGLEFEIAASTPYDGDSQRNPVVTQPSGNPGTMPFTRRTASSI